MLDFIYEWLPFVMILNDPLICLFCLFVCLFCLFVCLFVCFFLYNRFVHLSLVPIFPPLLQKEIFSPETVSKKNILSFLFMILGQQNWVGCSLEGMFFERTENTRATNDYTGTTILTRFRSLFLFWLRLYICD